MSMQVAVDPNLAFLSLRYFFEEILGEVDLRVEELIRVDPLPI